MTIITGEQIPLFRLKVLLKGLRLEVQTGMTLSGGRSCYKIVKKEFGLKGTKQKVYGQFEKIVMAAEQKATQ